MSSRRGPAPAALVLLAGLLAAGCGGGLLPPRDAADDAELRELKARVLELQRRSAVQQVELARLRERVAEIEAHAGGSDLARTSPAAGRTGSAAPPAVETGAPAPRFEIAEVLEEDDLGAEELEPEPAAAAAAPRPTPTPPPAGEAAASRPPPPAAQALYDQGYTLFHQGRFVDAESAFRRFLQEYPDNDHADNAQYWIGEARYAREDLRGALAAFRETVARYPHGNKVPDALLKAGQCLERLGDPEGARESYREVMRRFPQSAAAVVAEERLEG